MSADNPKPNQEPPTDAERAANYREVQKLSRPNRFLLMFGRGKVKEGK